MSSLVFVEPNGSNANDGSSLGMAKYSIAGAVAALPASGGKIEVFGTSVVSAPIELPSYTELVLNANAAIYLDANANCPVLTNKDHLNGNAGIVVRGGYIDGNKSIQSGSVTDDSHSGMSFYRADDLQLDGVTVRACKGKGIYVRGSTASIWGKGALVRGCRSKDNSGYGFAVYGQAVRAHGNLVYRTQICEADAFNVGGQYCGWIDNVAWNDFPAAVVPDGDGFAVGGFRDSVIGDNRVVNFRNGIRLYASGGGNPDNRIHDNRLIGADTNGYYGLLIETAAGTGNDLHDNRVSGFNNATTGYGALIGDGPTRSYQNDLRGNRNPHNVVAGVTCSTSDNVIA